MPKQKAATTFRTVRRGMIHSFRRGAAKRMDRRGIGSGMRLQGPGVGMGKPGGCSHTRRAGARRARGRERRSSRRCACRGGRVCDHIATAEAARRSPMRACRASDGISAARFRRVGCGPDRGVRRRWILALQAQRQVLASYTLPENTSCQLTLPMPGNIADDLVAYRRGGRRGYRSAVTRDADRTGPPIRGSARLAEVPFPVWGGSRIAPPSVRNRSPKADTLPPV